MPDQRHAKKPRPKAKARKSNRNVFGRRSRSALERGDLAVRRRCGVSNSHKITKWAAYKKLHASALVGPGCYRISKAQPFRCCRAAAKENEPQGCDFLQHLSCCLVFFASSGCPVPLSAESRMSSQADCPQKVSDDSSPRRFFLSPAPQLGGQIFVQGRASVCFLQIVRCQKFGKLRLGIFVA